MVAWCQEHGTQGVGINVVRRSGTLSSSQERTVGGTAKGGEDIWGGSGNR